MKLPTTMSIYHDEAKIDERRKIAMPNRVGITQWTVPWKEEELCSRAEAMGLSVLHLDLGSAEKGYPMMHPQIRSAYIEGAEQHHLQIVSLALNDLCNHGFTAGLKDARSEIAIATMKNAVETARKMHIPSLSVPHFFDNLIQDEDSFLATIEALRYLCDLAQEHGVVVYTENVLSDSNLSRLWQEVNRENLHLLFDTQNYAAMTNVNATEIFMKWQKYCGTYVHLKDGDDALGNRPLWKGTSNFDNTFSVIIRNHFSGDLILESSYAGQEMLQMDLKGVFQRITKMKE